MHTSNPEFRLDGGRTFLTVLGETISTEQIIMYSVGLLLVQISRSGRSELAEVWAAIFFLHSLSDLVLSLEDS